MKNYIDFLFIPWKIITFIIAIVGITLVAPYTGDPTWDYIDAPLMSILTYLTAPWSTGIIYRVLSGRSSIKMAVIALFLWMLSASWSYDFYLLWRDGSYPITWWTNLYASSLLYLSAGLFWNLEYDKYRGVIFSFENFTYPVKPINTQFTKIFWYCLPFMTLVTICIGYFLI